MLREMDFVLVLVGELHDVGQVTTPLPAKAPDHAVVCLIAAVCEDRRKRKGRIGGQQLLENKAGDTHCNGYTKTTTHSTTH
jgi:hypothetical protein